MFVLNKLSAYEPSSGAQLQDWELKPGDACAKDLVVKFDLFAKARSNELGKLLTVSFRSRRSAGCRSGSRRLMSDGSVLADGQVHLQALEGREDLVDSTASWWSG